MASVTIQKHTMQAACAGQVGHIYRERASYSNKDIKAELAEGNAFMGTAAICRQAIRDTIAKIDSRKPPKRVKKDRKTVAELCFPAPREGMQRADVMRFFESVTGELMAEGYHVAGGAIHADETHTYFTGGKEHESRLHLHLLVVPETEKGCNMKSWLTRQRYRDINTLADRVCTRELGYSYQDGTRSKSRGSVEAVKAQSAAEAVKLAEQLPELREQAAEARQKAAEAAQRAQAQEKAAEAAEARQKAAEAMYSDEAIDAIGRRAPKKSIFGMSRIVEITEQEQAAVLGLRVRMQRAEQERDRAQEREAVSNAAYQQEQDKAWRLAQEKTQAEDLAIRLHSALDLVVEAAQRVERRFRGVTAALDEAQEEILAERAQEQERGESMSR